MSSYRQIRRQTRRARRAGLQPIVVIDSPFPVPRGSNGSRFNHDIETGPIGTLQRLGEWERSADERPGGNTVAQCFVAATLGSRSSANVTDCVASRCGQSRFRTALIP